MKFTELRFEEWIESSLVRNGYADAFVHAGAHEHRYSKEWCNLPQEVLAFVQTTQPESWQRLQLQFEDTTADHFFKTLDKAIATKGIIDVLRNGFSTRGCHFHLAYFKPKSGLNPGHAALYQANRLLVVRQLHYSKTKRSSLDMVLFLNGLPIVTMELKNQLSGQSIVDSEKQYRQDRDPREPLFAFKRCLVHFCVDNDRVSMTTQLRGEKTKFLPYNKGIENPPAEDDYRTEYLWNEILLPDSLLDIVDQFVLLSPETEKEWSPEHRKVVERKSEVLIFPRYHQLEVIRNLRNAVKQEGVGNNYLIQHTTGSGKSYSIGWLAHALASLYQSSQDTTRMFDTILVLTDRKVLDKQLQATVSKLEQTDGVVNNVDIDSAQLKGFLEKGKDIIITTVQKFPIISETIAELKGKTFAVIIDEVHSSQSGETSKHIKRTLSKLDIVEDEEGFVDYEELIRLEIQSRGKQPHISFFGFTGTPKGKTLELFGRKNSQGHFVPFHSYTMKQSIAEGFTLDVLQHFTTYDRYFKLKGTGTADDEVLPESQAKRKMLELVDDHPATIRQKSVIILDHFVETASKRILGKARGMVVVRSRKHCVLFFLEMKRLMKDRGLPFSCLVAFSGTVTISGKDFTESQLNSENGMTGSSIPDALKDPRFRILIVSNKFQTGFDEPMLQSMYVDKLLSGVQCVQTLSRLNRTMSGKTDAFVLDFVNEPDEVAKSFQPYYTSTILMGETDPDRLYDLIHDIEGFQLYSVRQLDAFCEEFFANSESDAKLHPIIDAVVDAYRNQLKEDEQDAFKSKIQSFIRLYGYITQIAKFGELHWEKSFLFLRFLNKKLPKGKGTSVQVNDVVDLHSLRLEKKGETSVKLIDKVGEIEPNYATGNGKPEEPKALLSAIIAELNDLYGITLTDADKITLDMVMDRVAADSGMLRVMRGKNSEEDKRDYFESKVKELFVDFHGERLDFYRKVMDPKVFPMLMDGLYKTFYSGKYFK